MIEVNHAVICGCEDRSCSFVINNNDDDANDYGMSILKRESIFDLHMRDDGRTMDKSGGKRKRCDQ